MPDSFEDLRTFVTVVSAGGINAGAAELGIAKSAVSRRLSDLERRLGVTLLDRSGRRFEPTALGAEYVRRARTILGSLEDLDRAMRSEGERRELTIAAPAAIIAHALVPAFAEAKAAAPDRDPPLLRFVLAEGGNADGADIVVGPQATSGGGRELLATRLVICASPTYLANRGEPRADRELDRHPAIAIGGGANTHWRLAGRARPATSIALAMPDEEAAAAAAIAGLGLVQLPDLVVANALADGRLVDVLAEEAPDPTVLFATYAEDADVQVRSVVDALAQALARRSQAVGPRPA